MLLDNRPANRLHDLLMIGSAILPIELMHDHQPLAAVVGQRERRTRQHGRVGLLGRLLDVLRIVIAAANDDHVLHAARDKQLAVAKEAQDRPSARNGPRGPATRRAEHLLRFFAGDSNSLGPATGP